MGTLIRGAGKGAKFACVAVGLMVIYAGAKAKITGEPVTLHFGLTDITSISTEK